MQTTTAGKKKRFQMPHTYALIFFIVLICWLLTFIIPAGKFSTKEVSYQTGSGETETRSVLQQDSFRYMHPLKQEALRPELEKLSGQTKKMNQLEIKQPALDELLTKDQTITYGQLEEIGLSEDELYDLYGNSVFDTSKKLKKTAKVCGTQDHFGFGVLNYLFEGLVTGDRFGSAIGIVAMLLVVGGAFGIIMKTGAIDAGIYAFIRHAKGAEKLALPLIFIAFSLMGATFGASEEVIPFTAIIVPFAIALGYDSIVAVTISYVASQIGNATSWMSPFSIAVAQGIAGIPALSGAGFRIVMWVIVTALSCIYTLRYAAKVKADPSSSLTYQTDEHFRSEFGNDEETEVPFTLAH